MNAMLDGDDVQRLDNVLADTPVPGHTRRALIQRAAVGAVAAGAFGPAARAFAAGGGAGDSAATVLDTAVTAEALAVTYLTGLIAHAHDTGVTKFVDVLKAANAAEYDHYKALKGLGAKPLTLRFWAPDDFFKKGHVFPTLEVAETLFVDAYLIGTTVFAKAGQADHARYAGEILGVEAQHRTLVRLAQSKLPDNVAFESYKVKSMAGIVHALEQAGVGFGKQGAKPGRFHTFTPPPDSALSPVTHNSPQ